MALIVIHHVLRLLRPGRVATQSRSTASSTVQALQFMADIYQNAARTDEIFGWDPAASNNNFLYSGRKGSTDPQRDLGRPVHPRICGLPVANDLWIVAGPSRARTGGRAARTSIGVLLGLEVLPGPAETAREVPRRPLRSSTGTPTLASELSTTSRSFPGALPAAQIRKTRRQQDKHTTRAASTRILTTIASRSTPTNHRLSRVHRTPPFGEMLSKFLIPTDVRRRSRRARTTSRGLGTGDRRER